MKRKLLLEKDMRPGMFVFAKFHDAHHPRIVDYMEIGIIRNNIMREPGKTKLECLILTDAAFDLNDLPTFSATPSAPFLCDTTQVIEIEDNKFYFINPALVEKMFDKQQEYLKTALQAAQAKLNGFNDLREALKRVQADK